MKYNYLSIVILVFSITLQAQNLNLINAIQESNVEKVAQNLDGLLKQDKASLIDLAQTIINKTREDIWLADIARRPFSAKENQLAGLIVGCLGGITLLGQIIDFKNCKSDSFTLSILATVFGGLVFKLSYDYLQNLEKKYQDAIRIKQLIYNTL